MNELNQNEKELVTKFLNHKPFIRKYDRETGIYKKEKNTIESLIKKGIIKQVSEDFSHVMYGYIMKDSEVKS